MYCWMKSLALSTLVRGTNTMSLAASSGSSEGSRPERIGIMSTWRASGGPFCWSRTIITSLRPGGGLEAAGPFDGPEEGEALR